MIRTQEATGKTVDEARTNACALLGVEKDDINVSYEVLEMPQKTGFLGLKLTPAKVRVSVELPDEPVAAPAAPVEEPAPVVEEKAAPVAEPVVDIASVFTGGISSASTGCSTISDVFTLSITLFSSDTIVLLLSSPH